MDITRILTELKAQRSKLDHAISALEALSPAPAKPSRSKTPASKPRTARVKPSRSPSRRSPSASAKIIPFRLPRRARTKPSRAEQA